MPSRRRVSQDFLAVPPSNIGLRSKVLSSLLPSRKTPKSSLPTPTQQNSTHEPRSNLCSHINTPPPLPLPAVPVQSEPGFAKNRVSYALKWLAQKDIPPKPVAKERGTLSGTHADDNSEAIQTSNSVAQIMGASSIKSQRSGPCSPLTEASHLHGLAPESRLWLSSVFHSPATAQPLRSVPDTLLNSTSRSLRPAACILQSNSDQGSPTLDEDSASESRFCPPSPSLSEIERKLECAFNSPSNSVESVSPWASCSSSLGSPVLSSAASYSLPTSPTTQEALSPMQFSPEERDAYHASCLELLEALKSIRTFDPSISVAGGQSSLTMELDRWETRLKNLKPEA